MINKINMTEAMDAIKNDGRFITDSNALAQRVAERIQRDGGYAITGTFTEVYYDPADDTCEDGPITNAWAWVSTRGEDTRMDGVYRYDGTDYWCPITTSVITGYPDIDPLHISDIDDVAWMTDEEMMSV